MRQKTSKKTAALRTLSKALIVLLTLNWWVIPVLHAEERSILQDANLLDPSNKINVDYTPDQTTRNFSISPNAFRFLANISISDLDADGSAEYTVDLGTSQGIMTVYA